MRQGDKEDKEDKWDKEDKEDKEDKWDKEDRSWIISVLLIIYYITDLLGLLLPTTYYLLPTSR